MMRITRGNNSVIIIVVIIVVMITTIDTLFLLRPMSNIYIPISNDLFQY